MRLLAFILTMILAIPTVSAQWYETQGRAHIVHGKKAEARTKAMENALKKALLVAGASVSTVQQVVNGLLTQNEINIRASGNVNSFEVINETYQDNMVFVTVRADIIPQTRQCFSADYRKTLLITKSHLSNREHANIGGIYAIDNVVMKRLANKMRQEGTYLSPRLSIKSSTEFSRYNNSLQTEKIKNISMSLSDMTDTQYILYSEIEDLSFSKDPDNKWQFWQEEKFERYFHINIHVYNGNNGELVFQKNFQNSAPWTFGRREQVDVNSTFFWQSHYGRTVDQVIDTIIMNIDDNMMCQPTRGKIVSVSGDSVRFNLGEQHGVKLGDEFSLLHIQNFTADSGNSYAGFNVSPFKVKVTQVSQTSAQAQSANGKILDSIQLNDLVVRY